MSGTLRRRAIWTWVAAVTVFLAVRLCRLIDAHAVNVFFYDQWGYTWALLHETDRALFATGSLRASHPSADPALLPPFAGIPEVGGFFAQMGTWYQGLGGIVTELAYGFSRWSTRAEAFTIFGLLVAGMLCALALKLKLFGRLSPWDAAIAVVFMTVRQHESFLGTIYASHAALPILLALAFCFCWLIRPPAVRYAALLICNFLLLYTGHGFLLAAMTPLLFFLEFERTLRGGERREAALAAVILLITLLMMAAWSLRQVQILYVFPCFTFLEWPPTAYVVFAGYMFTRFLGMAGQSGWFPLAAGLACLSVLIAICAVAIYRLRRHALPIGSADGATLILAVFTLIFCAACAYGRACVGRPAAEISRYMTLLIPGFVAGYFAILRVNRLWLRRTLLAVYVLAVVAGSYPFNAVDRYDMNRMRVLKQQWIDCYRTLESVAQCDAQFDPIMPPQVHVNLEWQLQELKRRRLSFFADTPDGQQ